MYFCQIFKDNNMKRIYILILFLCFSIISNVEAGFINGSFKWGGRNRIYTVYVPNIYYTQGQKVPLLFGLHGFGDAIDNFKNICLTGIADTANFICVYPQALSDPILGANAWNSGATVLGVPFNRNVDDVGFLNALMDTVKSKYMIEDSKVYFFGYSFGSFMSQRMACENREKIAAIGAVSGTIGSGLDCQPGGLMPIVYFHGTSDDVIKYYTNYYGKPAEENRDFWVANNECNPVPTIDSLPDIARDGKTITHWTYTGATTENIMEFYKVQFGEHEWLGLPDNDISYCQTIWAFFKRFSRPQTTGIQQNLVKNSIDVFPNPSSGLFQIRLINGYTDVQQINILNTNGALVKTINTNGGLNFILSEKLTPGTYFIQLIGEKSVYEGKKIVVF